MCYKRINNKLHVFYVFYWQLQLLKQEKQSITLFVKYFI